MRYRFMACEVDEETHELRRDGQLVSLQPQAFAVLCYLLQQRHRVVPKAELLEQCWPGVFVRESALTSCLNKIRQAVNPARHQSPVIQTVSRHGYRLVANVTLLSSSVPSIEVSSESAGENPAALTDPVLPGASEVVTRPRLTERRPVTILACEVTATAPPLAPEDPEALYEAMQALQAQASALLPRLGGALVYPLPQGLLVTFGYPQVYEEAARRAVHAGLQLVATSPQPGWAVRVGIHTGPMVIELPSGDTAPAPLTVGTVPALALALCACALPGGVIISEAVTHLVRGYVEWKEPPLSLPMAAGQALSAYQVITDRVHLSRLDVAAPYDLTPFVGREPALTILRERWQQVQDGGGHAVVVTGEAGIGKSRLVQAFYTHLAGTPYRLLTCRCAPYWQYTALAPFQDLVRLLVWEAASPVEEPLADLERLMQQAQLTQPESVLLLAALLNLHVPPRRYPTLSLSPQEHRQRTLETLVDLLLALAAAQPMLLVIEDLHWSDPSTLECLGLLLDQVPTAALLLLLTCRPEFQAPWGGRAHITGLTLPRLPPRQAQQMLQAMPGAGALSVALQQQILATTDGVPLFVEEVTKYVLAAPPQTELHRTTATSPMPLPVTLQDTLLARFDQVRVAKRTVQVGAVLGRQFAYPLLQAVAAVEEAQLQADLHMLVAAELLYQRGHGAQATYRFKHALLQETAYQSLLTRPRQQLHQQAAQVYERDFPDLVDTQPELLAHHYTAAGCYEQAVHYWHRAGTAAEAKSAYQEGSVHLEQALEALQHLPESRERMAQACDLYLQLRRCLLPLWDLDRELVILRQVEALATALGDAQRLAQVHQDLTHCLWLSADLEQALISGQHALTLSPAIGDEQFYHQVQKRIARVYYSLGQYAQAIGTMEHALAPANRGPLQQLIPDFRWLAQFYAEVGAFPEAQANGEQAMRLAEARDNPYMWSNAYNGVGYLYLCQGDLPRAIDAYRRGLEISQRWRITQQLHGQALGLGVALSLTGEVTEALELLEQTLAQHSLATLLVSRQPEVRRLGEIYLCAGQVTEALQYTQTLLAFAQAHQERGRQAWAWWLLGEIVMAAEPQNWVQAEASYQQALALAEELGMRPLQAHIHRRLGTLYAQTARLAQASAALFRALGLYRDMTMPYWVPQVEAELARVTG